MLLKKGPLYVTRLMGKWKGSEIDLLNKPPKFSRVILDGIFNKEIDFETDLISNSISQTESGIDSKLISDKPSKSIIETFLCSMLGWYLLLILLN